MDIIVEDLTIKKPFYADSIAANLTRVNERLIKMTSNNEHLVRYLGIKGKSVRYMKTPGYRVKSALFPNTSLEKHKQLLRQTLIGLRGGLMQFSAFQIMHGDIAPDNLLVADDSLNIRLMDFETATPYGERCFVASARDAFYNPVVTHFPIGSWEQDAYASLASIMAVLSLSRSYERFTFIWEAETLDRAEISMKAMGYKNSVFQSIFGMFLTFGPDIQRQTYSSFLPRRRIEYIGMADFWDNVSKSMMIDSLGEV